jgi:menaquinone-dependent protoporphyrinogen oxidase
MRAVLVAYASEHGSTQAVAEHLGSVLANVGLDADVRCVESVDELEGYDAFVLGSAVHDQKWLPAARVFVHAHAGEWAGHPIWLFSVGMPGALRWPLSMFAMAEEPKLAAQFEGVIDPVGHHLFSGVIAADHLNKTGRLLFRAIGGKYGDYRDRAEIDAWAGQIADALATGEQAEEHGPEK